MARGLPSGFTYERDDAKSLRNVAIGKLPFSIASKLFEGEVLLRRDARRDCGEERMVAVGRIGDDVLTCVYTDRLSVRRIISLRMADRRERDDYRSAYPS